MLKTKLSLRDWLVLVVGGAAASAVIQWFGREILKDLVFGEITEFIRPWLAAMIGASAAQSIASTIFPALLGFGAVALVAWWFGWGRTRSKPVSYWLIGMLIFGVAFLVCLAGWRGYFKEPTNDTAQSDPLRWDFLGKQTNFLMGKTTDYGVEVRGFQATGQNQTGKFMKGLRGHVVSQRNGKTYPLQMVHHNKLVPLADYGIPGGNQFMVRAPFFQGEGIPVVQFLSEFGALTFVFEYDTTTYTHNFTADQVAAQARWLEQELKPQPKISQAGGVPLVEGTPRHLSDKQKDTVAEVLKNTDWQPASVWVRYANGCEECRRYASDLRSALTLAGWNGDFGKTDDEREDLVGLKLHVADLNAKPRTAALLAIALERASIRFEWSPWPEIEKDRTILFAYRPEE